MSRKDRRVFDIAGQHGLATRAQLLHAGWTYSAIRHALATTWDQPAPGVFVTHRGALTAKQRLVAGALWAGPSAVLTAQAALRIYDPVDQRSAHEGDHLPAPTLNGSPVEAIFVIPQFAARSDACGLAVRRRTQFPPFVAHRSGVVPVAPPARALVDHARWGGVAPIDLRALTISCLQRRVTTPELLHAALAEAGRPWQEAVRAGLRDFLAGAWSLPEASLQKLMESSDLPLALRNHRLRNHAGRLVGIPDVYLPTVGVAVQVHSRRYHDGWDREGNDLWADTVQRDNAYTAVGIAVVGVAPSTISDAPSTVLSQLARVCSQRRGIHRPQVSVECPDGCDSIDTHASLTSHSSCERTEP